MPDEPISREELSKLIGGKDKKPQMTVDEVIRQANTGELPSTVTKERVKKKYRIGKQKEMSDEDAETVTRAFIDDIKSKVNPPLQPQGMGDLKVSEQNQPPDPIYNAGILPQEENGINNQRPQGTVVGNPTGQTVYPSQFEVPDINQLHQDKARELDDISNRTRSGYKDLSKGNVVDFAKSQVGMFQDLAGMTGIDERLTAIGTDLTNKRKQYEQHFNESIDEFKKGNYKNFALKSGLTSIEIANYLGGVTGFPFAVPNEIVREVSPEGGQMIDATFGTIGKVGEYGMELSPAYRLAKGIGDIETANALKELGNVTAQFVIPIGLHGVIKGKLDSVPYDKVKDVAKEYTEEIKHVYKPDPNLANTIRSLQVAVELGYGYKDKPPAQLPPPQLKFVDTPEGKPNVEPLNPQGDLTGYIPPDPNILKFTPEQVRANNKNPLMLEPPFRDRIVVDPKGRAKVEPFNEAQVNPTPMSPEEIQSAKTNLKTNPEVTGVEPYVYKPKNKIYEDVTGADIQGIQTLSALEKEFNVAKQTGQPYPLTNVEHPMILDRLDKTSGATMDRLHQLTNAVKEYNGLEKSTKKFKVERPPNESIETYPPQPKINTETGQGSILNTEPISTVASEIKPPVKPSNEVILKNVVPKSDKRLITDEMLAEADKIIRSSPDVLSANPFSYYGNMGKAYVIKGARFIEDGLIDFKQWSKKMIDEFGTAVVPHLKNLYDDAKSYFQQSQKPTDSEVLTDAVKNTDATLRDAIYQKAEEKYGSADKWLYDTKGDIAKQMDIINQVFQDKANFEHTTHKGMRKAIDKVTEYLFDQFYNMTKKYGANGSELLYKLHDGNQTVTRLYKTVYPLLAKVKELTKDLSVEQKREYNLKVKEALENRESADAIIGDDPMLKEYYENAREFYDAFRTELKDIGVATVDDYYTRISQSKVFEKFGEELNLIRDDKGKSWSELNQAINADSPFVKKRTGELKNVVEDVGLVMEKYFHNMSKYIAYKDAIDYYYGDFTAKMPRRLRGGSTKYVADLIRENLDPQYLDNKLLTNVRDNIYVTALWNNPKSVLANALQRRLVDFFVSRDAYNVAKDIYKKDPSLYPQKLYQILNELNFEVPDYMEMGLQESMHSKYRNAMQKVDMFQKAEKNNWQFSHVGGVFDVLSKMPEYKRMLAEGKTPFEIAETLLQNKDTYTKAYRRALEIGNRTQFGAMSFNRPKAYNNPIARIIGMFTRFKFGQWQVMRDSFRKTEGIQGILSQNILRRGLSEDVYPVEMLREVETARNGLEGYAERLSDPTTKQFVGEYVDFLKGKEKELNDIIKTLEPMKPRKEVMAKWMKYYTAISAISFSWQLLTNWVQYALDDSKDKPEINDMLLKTAYDISPLPFYGTNMQGMFKTPILPNTELFTYGNFNWKGLVKESIRYGLKVTPLGIPDRFLLGLPSKKLTQLITGNDDVMNPRDIREVETQLRKERDKEKPDVMKLRVLEQQVDRLKYNSKNTGEFKEAEKERYFRALEKEKKEHPERHYFTPKIDSMQFEQKWKEKVLKNQTQP